VATDLGDRLKAARKERGLSQRQAARQSGVPGPHISMLETGRVRHPGTDVLIRLATAYGAPLAELLTLAGHVSFGEVDEDGRPGDTSNHELYQMSVWVPRGREAEFVEWLNAHGVAVYRMWLPELPARTSRD
jgi:transcriptional regulator with XRE-family HTH domain